MTGISKRKRIWGWFFFDWASQPYHTLLITFIFGPYFASVASDYFMSTGLTEDIADARAQAMWSYCLTVTGLIIGLGAPIMGAFADTTGRRLPWIIVFSLMYVTGAASIWGMTPDGANLWFGLIAFGLGFIGAEYALIFINSQLPSLGTQDEVGAISGSGFAFGYVAGVVSLLIMLALFVEQPSGKTLIGFEPAFGLDAATREGTRFVGPFTALWFAVFMIPYFLWVRDTGPAGTGRGIGDALGLLAKTVKGLRHRLSLSTYLGSSMFYRDALNGLYGFGGTYAILVLDWSITSVGIFGIIGAISAAVFSWVGGRLDARFGPKPVIIAAIWGLIAVCVMVVGMDRNQIFGIVLAPGSTLPDAIFFGCGVLIGGLGGTVQAASRTLMVRHTDPATPTENFGLYGLSGRATAFLAPALIGLVTSLSDSARIGISPVIFLFLIGLVLLRWVNAEGDREQWAGSS
ncbi:vacuole effluxer Atg22 like protein [Roseovarius sp. A-2]|uniref:MFS transporter n=1 Tax=Roseovarius sp. A-2 TaxID=1570360 RepID=UPI0009B545A3|nr:MFS transporter [Roseovarius sp. A-2]GAW34235.1 vacuole effluxer Atg22 like protein [Roseovarius sp. A-2]